ncbi:MAG: aldolase catalytic domain-containing protein [Clostridiales bacterium]|nr:aldolase catalytic domain-containing protein [Clostridiales bacterium]
MQIKGDLMTFRPDIKVLDCTLRDGGLVNSFRFSDDFVRDLYLANIKAGVDYMEFGYKASKELFNVEDYGPWKFCDDEDIRRIVGDNNTDLKISVMADVGRCDYKNDIHPRSESPVDMIRVACYIHQIPAAIEMIEDAHAKGYETTCNIMAVSTVSESQITQALELLCNSNVDGIYIVDSYGSFYPLVTRSLTEMYLGIAEKAGKWIGIHAHNNQQLAFANTMEALTLGASVADVTMCGMGRGAGNCNMELMLSFLRNPKYNIYPVIVFIQKHMNALRKECKWGYDLSYLLTGTLNQHPRDAIEFVTNDREDYVEFYKSLLEKM